MDSKSGHSQDQCHESLSINETNKLRAKLGLKPLEVESKSSERSSAKSDKKFKDDWGEFYHKPADNLSDKKFTEKIRDKLHNRKERKKIEKKLSKVKTLGEYDEVDDAAEWVEKTRRTQKEKELAEKRDKMLDEMEQEMEIERKTENQNEKSAKRKYKEKHLKGLKIAHSQEVFQPGSITILTLKDQEILADDSEDVLINPNIVQDEGYKQSNENKKFKFGLRPSYQISDEDPLDQYGNLKTKNLLSKYDEEIGIQKKDSFMIGESNDYIKNNDESRPNGVTLNMPEFTMAAEYYNDDEMIKFQKRKIVRNKKPKSGNKVVIEDDIPALIDEDNDAIDKALHKMRKAIQKANLAEKMDVDPVHSNEAAVNNSSSGFVGGNMFFDATAEFCKTLGDIPTYGRSGNRDEEEELLDFEKEVTERKHTVDEVDNVAMNEVGWSSIEMPKDSINGKNKRITEVAILDEEPLVGSGVAAALKLAMSKGYLEKETLKRTSTSRFKHLEAQHYSIEDKTHGDEDKIFGNRRDRYTGPLMDFKEKDFKPTFKLDYHDDEGKDLKPKEAFRYLSHKFHGKGPGKNKIEKRLRRKEQERLMNKMSSTDTPLGTLNLLRHKQKEAKTPYVIVSGSKPSTTSK